MDKPMAVVLVVLGALSVGPVLFPKDPPPRDGTPELARAGHTFRILDYTVTVGIGLRRIAGEPTVKPDQPWVVCTAAPDTIGVVLPTSGGRAP